MSNIMLSPSILSADSTRLAEEIEQVEKYADMLHIDVMDGHFVPNLSFGTKTVRDIRSITKLPLEVHLMITQPEKFYRMFIDGGASIIIYHVEVAGRSINHSITESGVKAGISLNPDTLPQTVFEFTDDLYELLVMGVSPGFGNQKFISSSLEKLRWFRTNLPDSILLNIDGGVNAKSMFDCIDAGAKILTMGGAIYNSNGAGNNIIYIRRELEKLNVL